MLARGSHRVCGQHAQGWAVVIDVILNVIRARVIAVFEVGHDGEYILLIHEGGMDGGADFKRDNVLGAKQVEGSFEVVEFIDARYGFEFIRWGFVIEGNVIQ